jgi:hypothetical protein
MSRRGVPFEIGNHFGRGRPTGSRNKSTIAVQRIFAAYAAPLSHKCIAEALKGDRSAMRLCMERTVAPYKEPSVKVRLPAVTTTSGVAEALSAVLHAVASGKLTPTEGQKFAEILEGRRRVIETEEHEKRLQSLEAKASPGRPRRRNKKVA